jgi:hypothetical protein
MPYSVYAVFSVYSWSWYGEIERHDLTSGSSVTVELMTSTWEMRTDGANHHEELEPKELRVRVKLPSTIGQVKFPIQCVILLIRSLLNTMMQVVRLISQIRCYPAHRSHLHRPSLCLPYSTLASSQNTKLDQPSLSLCAMIMSLHWVQHTPSPTYTKYSIHWVRHSPSTATAQNCLSSLHSHDYELTPECSFCSASLQDRQPSGSYPFELKCKVTLLQSVICKSTNWSIESQHSVGRPSTASKY